MEKQTIAHSSSIMSNIVTFFCLLFKLVWIDFAQNCLKFRLLSVGIQQLLTIYQLSLMASVFHRQSSGSGSDLRCHNQKKIIKQRTSLKSLRLRKLLDQPPQLTQPYWAYLSLTGPYLALLSHTRPYWALLNLTGPYWAYLALLSLTQPYWALLGLTMPYQALLGLTGPYWTLLGLTGPYWELYCIC